MSRRQYLSKAIRCVAQIESDFCSWRPIVAVAVSYLSGRKYQPIVPSIIFKATNQIYSEIGSNKAHYWQAIAAWEDTAKSSQGIMHPVLCKVIVIQTGTWIGWRYPPIIRTLGQGSLHDSCGTRPKGIHKNRVRRLCSKPQRMLRNTIHRILFSRYSLPSRVPRSDTE